jgi:hypothetical protein
MILSRLRPKDLLLDPPPQFEAEFKSRRAPEMGSRAEGVSVLPDESCNAIVVF